LYFKSVYEEVASLYLRLNGFFQATNYVFEGSEPIRGKEVDIIALRPMNSMEQWGNGQAYNPDKELFEKICELCNICSNVKDQYNIAIIADVKGTQTRPWRYRNGNEKQRHVQRVENALGLLGITPISNYIKDLLECGYAFYNKNRLVVVLAGFHAGSENNAIDISRNNGTIAHLSIPLSHAAKFILGRIKRFTDKKGANIVQYPSPIFQALVFLVRNKIISFQEDSPSNSQQGSEHHN